MLTQNSHIKVIDQTSHTHTHTVHTCITSFTTTQKCYKIKRRIYCYYYYYYYLYNYYCKRIYNYTYYIYLIAME